MQKLLVYQSMWAMERRAPDGMEWSLEEKLTMIRDAGFDGAGVRFFDFEQARAHVEILKDYGLTWQAQCYPQSVDDLKPILDNVAKLGAEHLNLQPDVRPYRVEECIPYIEGWRRLADQAGVRMHIETHRDRMTTDLFFTLHLLDCFPDLKLTGDISHYLVGREFAGPPISDENHRLMHRILENCWGFHGRVASREQIQVPISFPHNKPWVDLFMGWWDYGFRSWRRRAGPDATLTFLCEMGPKPYAITDRNDADLADRWMEAQMMKDMIRGLWARIEAEDQAAGAKAAE